MTDISDTLAPNGDQLDAVDLRGNPPRIFTVTKVDVKKQKGADQPVSVHLAEFPRVWRPGKSMRRVLAYCWGNDSAGWVDGQHRVELYCDDGVVFAGEAIGGTRISRISHIDGPKSVPLITGRGQSGTWKVKPLPEEAPTTPTVSDATLTQLVATFDRKGIREETRLSGANSITGGSATDLEVLTEPEAQRVLAALEQRPDADVPQQGETGGE